MSLIPAEDKTNEETVTEAKAALEARASVEQKLKTRLEATTRRVEELTTAAGDASAEVFIGQESDVGEEELDRLRSIASEKIDQLDAAKKERDALTYAITVATGQTSDARMALARIAYRNHINVSGAAAPPRHRFKWQVLRRSRASGRRSWMPASG